MEEKPPWDVPFRKLLLWLVVLAVLMGWPIVHSCLYPEQSFREVPR